VLSLSASVSEDIGMSADRKQPLRDRRTGIDRTDLLSWIPDQFALEQLRITQGAPR
jgi:hypothetical protein